MRALHCCPQSLSFLKPRNGSDMKRPRAETYDVQPDDDEDDYLGNSSADEVEATKSSSSSGSSDDEDGGSTTNLGDFIEKESLVDLLLIVLRCMLPGETGASTAGRLSTTPTDTSQNQFNDLASVSVKCTVQHGLELMSMTREALCRRAKLESMKLLGDAAFPSMWVLRWIADKKETIYGPFETDVVKKWKTDGYFHKKPAVVSDANDLADPRVWTDPAKANLFV